MPKPKTIITYLVDWNPTGIKTIELSSWVWKGVIIPRSKLKEAKDRRETNQAAIYFLFWEDSAGNKKAYIWEAENLISRLSGHDSGKDFWDTVIAFISKDNNLTKWDIKFLESHAIQKAIDSKRYNLLNVAEPAINNLPEYQICAMEDFLENVDLLISALGYPILKEMAPYPWLANNKKYYLKLPWCNAKWIYTEDGFIILTWSTGRLKETASFWGKAKQMRKIFIDSWVIAIDGEHIRFTDHLLCNSPSLASSLLAGIPSNGWKEWKDEEGKTLDESERQALL